VAPPFLTPLSQRIVKKRLQVVPSLSGLFFFFPPVPSFGCSTQSTPLSQVSGLSELTGFFSSLFFWADVFSATLGFLLGLNGPLSCPGCQPLFLYESSPSQVTLSPASPIVWRQCFLFQTPSTFLATARPPRTLAAGAPLLPVLPCSPACLSFHDATQIPFPPASGDTSKFHRTTGFRAWSFFFCGRRPFRLRQWPGVSRQ